MKRLIECVPNFSEGRDLAKVDALVAAMSGVPGAWVLDRTSDSDHNRSVITLAGDPEAVAEAAIRGVGKAAELIDLTRQTGAHPRIGATDVLPFIPLEGISIEECVVLARRVGQEIWDRYRIPIYFYESAATRPERVNLANVRKGEFEGLREDALRDPSRSPDIGEPRLHPTAGAIALGVRKILVAYNIHLNTSDVSVAKKLARAIRFSSGGLRYVKAIGVELKTRNLAQVSINLTDFEQTPLHRVFEMVKREAEQYGCSIVGSEIIGLIPRKAIELSAEYYLQFENFNSSRVLETRLADVAGGAGPITSTVEPQAVTAGSQVSSMLVTLRDAIENVAARMASGESVAYSAENEIVRNLEFALTASQIFESAVQLETTAGPSILSDLRVVRMMSMAAARAALENVRNSLENSQNNLSGLSALPGQIRGSETHDAEIASKVTTGFAIIEARLSAVSAPVTAARET